MTEKTLERIRTTEGGLDIGKYHFCIARFPSAIRGEKSREVLYCNTWDSNGEYKGVYYRWLS